MILKQPTDSQVSLHRKTHCQVGCPWHQDVLNEWRSYVVECPTQITLVTGVCQLFHDKYQWEIWKNTAGKSARSYVTFINRRTYTNFNLQQLHVSPYLQRIPDVGEKVDIGQAVHFEHLWIWSTALFQRGYFKINYIIGDLDEGVVDDASADVDDVEDGERHQQVVERRSHLGLPEVETIIRVLNVTI